MVYLSEARLDPRAATRALGDLYALHQLAYAAFPNGAGEDGGRILFRLEAAPGSGEPRLLIQSDQKPQWERIEGRQIVGTRGPKPWEPQFAAGQMLRFRLRASPTKRIPFPKGHPKAGHQRIGLLTRTEQIAWLARQGERAGFALCDTPPDWFDPFDGAEPRTAVQVVTLGHLKGRKRDSAMEGEGTRVLTHLAVDFEGLLRVTDSSTLATAVAVGIGPGKAFGLGLLSLASAK